MGLWCYTSETLVTTLPSTAQDAISPSPFSGGDEEASWALIKANYVRAVINPGTPALTDEKIIIKKKIRVGLAANSYH